MEDEVSGSDRDISLSVTYLRAVFLAKMCKRLHRLVHRLTLKNKTKQRETNKSRRRGFQIHNDQCWKFTFRNSSS